MGLFVGVEVAAEGGVFNLKFVGAVLQFLGVEVAAEGGVFDFQLVVALLQFLDRGDHRREQDTAYSLPRQMTSSLDRGAGGRYPEALSGSEGPAAGAGR